MRPIAEIKDIERFAGLIREMMEVHEDCETEFNSQWVTRNDWKVVPVESMARIPVPTIPRIVSALKHAKEEKCIAMFAEAGSLMKPRTNVDIQPPSYLPTCFEMVVSKEDFQQLNQIWGCFRFIVTSPHRTWAIACSESYNLFGAPPKLLEEMLGMPVESARDEFLTFVATYAEEWREPLLRIATHYAKL